MAPRRSGNSSRSCCSDSKRVSAARIKVSRMTLRHRLTSLLTLFLPAVLLVAARQFPSEHNAPYPVPKYLFVEVYQ